MPRAGQDPDSSAPLIFGTSVEVASGDNLHGWVADLPTPPCTTVVRATPLVVDHAVLLAVPVTVTSQERQLSMQAPARLTCTRQDGSVRAGSTVAVAPALPISAPSEAAGASRRSGLRLALSSSAGPAGGGRLCQAQGQRDVCFRQGTRMCQLCKRWVCSEHASDFGGTLERCQACARSTRGSGAQRCECLESRRQTLLCALVCIGLFVLFYLGPYRDGRK